MSSIDMAHVLVVNPHDDATFVASVEALADRLGPDAMQAELRRDYPHAVVRAREITDSFGDIWYIYREGRWTPPRNAARPDLAGVR